MSTDLQNSKISFQNDVCLNHKLDSWKGIPDHLRICRVQFERQQPEALSGNAHSRLVQYLQGLTHQSKCVIAGQEKMREAVYTCPNSSLDWCALVDFLKWLSFSHAQNLGLPRKMMTYIFSVGHVNLEKAWKGLVPGRCWRKKDRGTEAAFSSLGAEDIQDGHGTLGASHGLWANPVGFIP